MSEFKKFYKNTAHKTLDGVNAVIVDGKKVLCTLINCTVSSGVTIYPKRQNIVLRNCYFSTDSKVYSSLSNAIVSSHSIKLRGTQPENVVKVNWLTIYGKKGSIVGNGLVTVFTAAPIQITSSDKAIVCDGCVTICTLEAYENEPFDNDHKIFIESEKTVIKVEHDTHGDFVILRKGSYSLDSTRVFTKDNRDETIY